MQRRKVELVLFIIMGAVILALVGFALANFISPGFKGITALPYANPDEVWVSRAYSPEHQGVDISASSVVEVFAPTDGTFLKQMYYHAGVPRWQVNAEVRKGDYAVELLFEPGDSVSEADAQIQFDSLIADGTKVSAGDLLGRRTIAAGQPYSIMHLAIRRNSTGVFECPLAYLASGIKGEFMLFFHRDNPAPATLCSSD